MAYSPSIRAVGVAIAAAALLVSGCSGDAPAASCEAAAVPDSCPTPIPSWSNEVSEIFMGRCAPCHFPGGVEDGAEDFSTYAGVSRIAGTIEGQVASCGMPPSDAGALSATDREALLAWIVCRAPDN